MKKMFLFVLAAGVFFASCNDDDGVDNGNLQVSFSNLEDLGADYVYEGWFITSNGAQSAGRFSVDNSGSPSQSSFTFPADLIDGSSAYVLTIEPANETGAELAAPSSVHILAGDFNGATASLNTADPRAIGTDFANIAGGYILATPTTAATDDELSGVWFLDPSAGPGAGLNLPTLATGWKYEGWAVIDGTPYSTGTFTSAMGADESGEFSGPDAGPPFPGEDFIQGRPIFPTNLQGATIVISVEPDPDNSMAPFSIKPLVSMVASDAADHTFFDLGQNLGSLPSGTVTR